MAVRVLTSYKYELMMTNAN